MSNYSFGEFLKNIRQAHNFTRKELSDGICSEKRLMRIENGSSEPSVYVLHHLSSKLNIDLNEYYKIIYSHVSLETIRQVNLLESYEKNGEFIKLKLLVDKLGNNPDFISGKNAQRLSYAKALLAYHDGNTDNAEVLNMCFKILKSEKSDFKFENNNTAIFSNSAYCAIELIADIYKQTNKNDKYLAILKYLMASLERNYLSTAYKNYYSMPFIRRLYQETLYKLAVFYFDSDADSSLSYVEKALSFSHNHDLSHLLPELLELKCKLLYRKNQANEAYELYIAAERLRREFDGVDGKL